MDASRMKSLGNFNKSFSDNKKFCDMMKRLKKNEIENKSEIFQGIKGFYHLQMDSAFLFYLIH